MVPPGNDRTSKLKFAPPTGILAAIRAAPDPNNCFIAISCNADPLSWQG
jgi:hypothetical protein